MNEKLKDLIKQIENKENFINDLSSIYERFVDNYNNDTELYQLEEDRETLGLCLDIMLLLLK
jgi:hypothetical protein